MKKIILTIIFIISTVLIFAQQANEITLEIGGGLSTLKCNPIFGKTNAGFGGNIGLGISHHFNKSVAIGLGIDMSLHNSKFDISGANTKLLNQKDSYSDVYQLNSVLKTYKESEQIIMANIPFSIKIMLGNKHQFFLQPGIVVEVPIKAKYSVENAEIQNSAYYPKYNNTINGPTFAGFGDFKNYSTDGTMILKNIAFSLMLDLGMKWNISKNFVLYTGIYGNLGFSDILPQYSQNFVIQNPSDPPKFSTNGIIVSHYEVDKPFVDKANLVSAGIKIKIGFRIEKEQSNPNNNIDENIHNNNNIEKTSKPQKTKNQVVTTNKQDSTNLALEKRLEELYKQLAELERRAAEEEEAKKREIFEQQERERIRLEYEQQQREQREREAREQKERDFAMLNGYVLYGFDFKEAILTFNQQSELFQLLNILYNYPTIKILCTGHTDERGTEKKNNEVGFERAKIVKDFFVQNGIDANRILILSKAQIEPIYPNTDEINRSLNRRVVITIVEE